MQTQALLSPLKWYFIMLKTTFAVSVAAEMLIAYQYAVSLIIGNTMSWIDRLEVKGSISNTLSEFEKLFIN